MHEHAELTETLGEAQRLGFLGAAPIDTVIRHAESFVVAIPPEARRVIDLGAGGGTPGLVVACARPELELVLLDRMTRRTDFLHRAVHRLGLTARVTVVTADAAQAARSPIHRGTYDVVVARGLGPPAVTAELARGFLCDGGRLIVSEPPADLDRFSARWPLAAVVDLGFEPAEVGDGVAILRAAGPVPPLLPARRVVPRW